jgi:lipoate-protein ligase A
LATLFDVERFRAEPRRVVRARHVMRPTLVLGSTQRDDVVDVDAGRRRGVDLVHRRGGGGAVYLDPGSRSQLWLDAWIPSHDPLWRPDVSRAAEWVGEWWVNSLATDGLEVHRGELMAGEFGHLVCFAGRGPGEVCHGGRKLVGVTQWRGREGALFSSCAYWHWDPAPLLELLGGAAIDPDRLAAALATTGVGLAELSSAAADPATVTDRLVASFAGFGA